MTPRPKGPLDERILGARCECAHARLCHTDINEDRQICAHCECVRFRWDEKAETAGAIRPLSLTVRSEGAAPVGLNTDQSVNTGGAHPSANALREEVERRMRKAWPPCKRWMPLSDAVSVAVEMLEERAGCFNRNDGGEHGSVLFCEKCEPETASMVRRIAALEKALAAKKTLHEKYCDEDECHCPEGRS